MESAIFISVEASLGLDREGERHLQALISAAFGHEAHLTLVPGGRLFTKGEPALSRDELDIRYPDDRPAADVVQALFRELGDKS